MARCAKSRRFSLQLGSLSKVAASIKTTAPPVLNRVLVQILQLQRAPRRALLLALQVQMARVHLAVKSLPTKLKQKLKLKPKQKQSRRAKRKLAQPKANNPHTWPLAMQTKLIDQWYALCRDASRQRLVIVALAILSALLYLVTALGFTSSSSVASPQDSRHEIPAGFRAVAMQSVGPLPELRAGDYVDVIINATVVLDRVLVIDVALQPGRSETVVLAVPLTNAPKIADAAALGIVALVLVG